MGFECLNRRCEYWETEREGHCSPGAMYSEACSIRFIREKTGECPIPYYIYMKNSEVCSCGRKKLSGKPFCFKCTVKLPRDIRAHLGCRIGDGFEEAFDSALRALSMINEQLSIINE